MVDAYIVNWLKKPENDAISMDEMNVENRDLQKEEEKNQPCYTRYIFYGVLRRINRISVI